MGLADELTQLHALFKDNAITAAEYEQLKGRIIRGNLVEAKSLLNSNSKGGVPNALQVGAMAAAGTFAGRMIADHLKNDHELHKQLENIKAYQMIDGTVVEYHEVTYEVETNTDVSDIDFGI